MIDRSEDRSDDTLHASYRSSTELRLENNELETNRWWQWTLTGSLNNVEYQYVGLLKDTLDEQIIRETFHLGMSTICGRGKHIDRQDLRVSTIERRRRVPGRGK